MTFDDIPIIEALSAMGEEGLDGLPFGVVGLDSQNTVQFYNKHEERYSGLPRGIVVGRHFFFDVAPCMNNYMVAERLADAQLDVTLPYVLTFRMRPTPVRLRLLRGPEAPRRWVLIARV
jgi:photoactive yellow protein